jgi:hypothetical protein
MSDETFSYYESYDGDDYFVFQVYNFFPHTIDYSYFKLKKEIQKNYNKNESISILRKYVNREVAIGWCSGDVVYIELKRNGE